MRVVRSIQSPLSNAVAAQRAAAFLVEAGYRQSTNSDGILRFRRGSLVGTIANFDPRRWSCEVTVRIVDEGTSCRLDVKAGISSDPFEKRFAEELVVAELRGLQAAVVKNEVSAFDAGGLKQRVASHVYRVVGPVAGIFMAAVLGVVAAALAFTRPGFTPAASLGIGCGAFIVLSAICLGLWARLGKR